MREKAIYALGFFDGVHLGHQALLRACKDLARQQNCSAGAVTFIGHPDLLVGGAAPGLINTPADRKALLQQYGTQKVLELPFNTALMQTHWSTFLEQLVAGGAAGFVCGSDFRFGAKGIGTAKKLAGFCENRGLTCAIVPQQELHGIRISSTCIRGLLESGEIEKANEFLGHPHILTGTVVAGQKIGRTIGIPTANLHLPENLVVPKFGVYACSTCISGRQYLAVTNIGTRPTVGGRHVTVEPWILNYKGDLYGKDLTLHFYRFLRPEQKFDSLEQLQREIQLNAYQTRRILDYLLYEENLS